MHNIATEYRIQSTGAGYLHATDRGWLRFDGRDRAAFLQALLTNDIDAIAPLKGGYGAYLTPQGRMITDLDLLNRGDHMLAGVPAQLATELTTGFDRLIFTEDVQVSDVSSSLVRIAIVGARAAEIAAGALGAKAGDVQGLEIWSQLNAGDAFIVRDDTVDADIFKVVIPKPAVDAFVDALERAGARPVSADLLEAMRIDAARPRFGADMTTETIPLEAGLLDRAISQTKGCYVGQEVIIRVLHRGGGRVAKLLAQITATAESAGVPPAGAKILIQGNEVGTVTSSAWSPAVDRPRALGYVRREHAEIATQVAIQWTDPAGSPQTIAGALSRVAG